MLRSSYQICVFICMPGQVRTTTKSGIKCAAYLLELCFWHSFQEGCSFTRDTISDPRQPHSLLWLTSSLSSHRMCCAPEAQIWPVAPACWQPAWVSLVTSDPTNDPYQRLPRIPLAPTANCPSKHILEVSSHDLSFYLDRI